MTGIDIRGAEKYPPAPGREATVAGTPHGKPGGGPFRALRAAQGRKAAMAQSIAHLALLVRDYDEAIAYFTRALDD